MTPKNGTLLLLILCACAGCACAGRQSLRGARKLGFFDDLVAKKSYGHGCTFDGDCKSDHCIRFKCADGSKDSTCDNNGQCYAEECAGGKCWCNAGKCKAKLSVNSGCNDGAQCSSNSCIRFRCADAELNSTCDFNHQCKGSDTWCDAGRCKKKLPKDDGCNDGAQCSSGHCIRFKCADGSKDSTCDNNGQCYAEECAGGKCWCNAGKCKAKLSVNSGCNDGAQCSSNSCIRFRCADAELDSTCDFNHQCKGSDTWCDAGRCKKKLPKDDGCNDGAQCSSGHCIRFKCADGTAGATCDNNAQCYDEDNMFCRAGKCISPKEEFSYREAKPECITNVKDQGWCGSCWAFATATAASQRLCLAHKPVSSMDILCDVKAKSKDPKLCTGGYSKDGLNNMVSDGAVRIQKFPTPFGGVPESICTDPLWGVGGSNRAGTDHTKLEAGKHYYDDGSGTNTPFRNMQWEEPHFVEKVKHAILTFGPVPVEMNIRNAFTDFRADPACWASGGGKPFSRVESKSCCKKHYVGPGGSAWCDKHGNTSTGGLPPRHAMVITGWGTFEGEQFWEVQNSWGTFEMNGGLMRIAQDYARKGDAGSEFEVVTSIPVNWAPAGLAPKCEGWCANHRDPWSQKCGWDTRACTACAECVE